MKSQAGVGGCSLQPRGAGSPRELKRQGDSSPRALRRSEARPSPGRQTSGPELAAELGKRTHPSPRTQFHTVAERSHILKLWGEAVGRKLKLPEDPGDSEKPSRDSLSGRRRTCWGTAGRWSLAGRAVRVELTVGTEQPGSRRREGGPSNKGAGPEQCELELQNATGAWSSARGTQLVTSP